MSLTLEEVLNAFEELRQREKARDEVLYMGKEGNVPTEEPFQKILAMTLSPDGHYALILASRPNTDEPNPDDTNRYIWKMYLLHLDDLTLKEVKGIDPDIISLTDYAYRPVMEWNSDTLIINTKNGTQAWQFQKDI